MIFQRKYRTYKQKLWKGSDKRSRSSQLSWTNSWCAQQDKTPQHRKWRCTLYTREGDGEQVETIRSHGGQSCRWHVREVTWSEEVPFKIKQEVRRQEMDERLEQNLSIAPNAIKAHICVFLDFKWKEELIVFWTRTTHELRALQRLAQSRAHTPTTATESLLRESTVYHSLI